MNTRFAGVRMTSTVPGWCAFVVMLYAGRGMNGCVMYYELGPGWMIHLKWYMLWRVKGGRKSY